MKIVVIGGTGLIGSKVVEKLNAHGHDAVPAAPQTGVNTLTGEGLEAALAGADVVVDVSNSPSFADDDVMSFFVASTSNDHRGGEEGRREAPRRALGGRHGNASGQRLPARQGRSGGLIKRSGVPYSIVHATQFFEFTRAIADASTIDGKIHLAPVHYQPIASDDVAAAVGRVAAGAPLNGTVEIGGPERVRMDEFIPAVLAKAGDTRELVVDEHATYFGTELADDSLVPGPDAELGATTYEVWAKQAG